MAKLLDVLRAWIASCARLAGLGGIVAALVIVLRYRYKRSRLISSIHHLDEKHYDFIIVGGGTSGCVLASRLSEDPNVKVLLLEAGGSGKALALTRMPLGFGLLFRTDKLFNFHTEPQTYADGQRRYWPRAKLLGGCTQINAQMAQYGAPQDYDDWAAITEDPSWSWSQFSQYFKKFETYKRDERYPEVDLSARGSSGPVRVGYFNYATPASKSFIKACMSIGIPFTPDFNKGTSTMGVSRVMTYIDKKHQRVSSESAYLTPDVLARPNLTVAIHAHVTRLLFDTSSQVEGGEPRVIGVEYGKLREGFRYKVFARKEVIMSAGAIHTPHILMLSGLGPASHLQSHDITPVLDIPSIGQNLVDHPVIDAYFKDKHDASLKYIRPKTPKEAFSAIRDLLIYTFGYGGPLTSNLGDAAAFVRVDDPVVFPTDVYGPPLAVDSSAGVALVDEKGKGKGKEKEGEVTERGPDLELYTTPLAYKEHGLIRFDMHTFGLHACLLRPTSRGEVLLKSKDPWELSSVNPNYLQTPEDVEKLVRGMKICLRIAQTEPLASHLDQDDKDVLLDHQLHLKTDEEIRKVVLERVETLYHPASTCRMAPRDQEGVVDAKLRVYGVKGLRVCDASIFPLIVSGHPVAACYATAEKLADMIKEEYGSSQTSKG